MPPAYPPSPQAAPTPVFVDDTGRRHRLVRLVGWVVGGVTVAYLALLGISLVGSPGLLPLSLPAIGRILPDGSAPQIGTAVKFGHGGRELRPAGQAVDPVGVDAGATGTTTGPGAQLVRQAAPRPSSTPAPRRTPSPTPSSAATSPTHTPQGNPSPAGTARPTHSPSPHSSTNNGHGSPHNVKGSPTPSPT